MKLIAIFSCDVLSAGPRKESGALFHFQLLKDKMYMWKQEFAKLVSFTGRGGEGHSERMIAVSGFESFYVSWKNQFEMLLLYVTMLQCMFLFKM